MPNLLAMSFEGELAPSFDLRCLQPGHKPPDGWGIGYYPGGDPAAVVLKEPAPPHGSIRSELIKAWEHLASSLFMVHIRTATWGNISAANTQPFSLGLAGRDWMFAHSGSLRHRLELDPKARFEPVGSTDTELVFCELLSRIADRGWRSIGDIDPSTLRLWFDVLNDHGDMTSVLTDGRDMCVYADRNDEGHAYVWQLLPPHGELTFGDDDLQVDLTRRGIKSRKGVIVCSDPLVPSTDGSADWKRLSPGSMVVVRQGAIRAEVEPPASIQVPGPVLPLAGGRDLLRPSVAEARRYAVSHRTAYRYDKAVERSTHLLRLVPYHDRLQRVNEHAIKISVDGQVRDYDDVFGNRVRRLLVETAFTEMIIEATSQVDVLDTDPLSFRPLHFGTTIPLVWMPWQRHMLQPFLLPPELAESELYELTEYAMSYAKRNSFDLLDTLLDLNQSIYREYEYRQGSTSLSTTAFDVFASRRGVCQDFTNLFICLARLLGVPARYTCGYIYTGPKNPNRSQSEASHAWVQVYLPEVGWKGFDPTNGILTQTNHIRVAVGRNYVDATPTSGTIFVGGGAETLEVAVKVEPIG